MPELTELKAKVTTEADLKALDQAESKVKSFSDNVRQGAEQFSKLAFAAGGAAVAGLTAAGAVGLKAASSFESSKVAFTTLMDGNSEAADNFINKIQQAAKTTPFDQQGLIDINQLLVGSGLNADKSLDTVLMLGDALSATGKGSAELTRIGNTISQVFGKGKADAVDFKELVNAGWVTVRKDVSETLGVTMDEFDTLVSNGAVGFEELEQTLKRVTGEGGRFFGAMANQSTTFSGSMSNLMDTINIGLGNFMMNTGIFDAIKTGVQAITEFLGQQLPIWTQKFTDFGNAVKPSIDAFIGAIGPTIDFIRNNQFVLDALVFTIGTALVIAIGLAGVALVTAMMPILSFMALVAAIGVAIAALKYAFDNNFLGIKDDVTGVINFFTGTLFPALQTIFKVVEFALIVLYNAFNLIWQGIKLAVQVAAEYISNTALGKVLIGGFELVKNNISKFLEGWENFWGGMSSTTTGAVDGIVKFVRDMVDKVKGFVNEIIVKANGVGKNIPGYKEIPMLAEGTSRFTGGPAIVGENGPELVTLPRGAQVTPNDELGSMRANVTQINHIYSDIDTELALRDLAYAVGNV